MFYVLSSTAGAACVIGFGVLALFASEAAGAPADRSRVSGPVSVASTGSDPTIASDASKGAHFVAWTRAGKSAVDVVVAQFPADRQGAGDPVAVSAGDSDIVSSAVDPPQVALGPKGEVYVLYERRVSVPGVEQGRGILRLARSADGGRSFAAPVDVVSDGVETGAGMANLAIAPDGAVLVAWLDSRDAFARARLPEDQRPKDVRWLDSDDPVVEVRLARSTDGGASFAPSVLVAQGASERSRVVLGFGPDGTYYASWRAKLNQFKGSYDSVRDVAVSASSDQGATWSRLVKVHDDRFKAGSCPQVTHGLAVDSKGRVHVAWYSGSSRKPGIYYAVSTDSGKSFSEPVTLLTDAWIPYANVKLSVDESDGAWIAFEDRRKDGHESVALVHVDPEDHAVAQLGSWPGRAPDIVATRAGETAVVWTGAKGEIQIVHASSKQ